jgi:hypothetical protein
MIKSYNLYRKKWNGVWFIHEFKPSPLASLLMVFRRLFGLISWSLRLHSKNLTARGVDASLFRVPIRALQYKPHCGFGKGQIVDPSS